MCEVAKYKFNPEASSEGTYFDTVTDMNAFITKVLGSCANFGFNQILSEGNFKYMGWIYDLRPYLKKYWVKQHGSIQEYYAPNKTILRKAVYGRIDKIVEVK